MSSKSLCSPCAVTKGKEVCSCISFHSKSSAVSPAVKRDAGAVLSAWQRVNMVQELCLQELRKATAPVQESMMC